MDALSQQLGEGGVDRALPLNAAHAGKARRDDLDREMAFAARIMAGVAAVQLAVVTDEQMRRIEGLGKASGDFFGDRTA